MNLKVKQKIPLKIKRMGINGEGIGFYQKTLVFVPGALKGEDIYCQITSIRRNFELSKAKISIVRLLLLDATLLKQNY
ncbi:RNA methyltransferase [Streptococcus pneumoniae]|nr:RNA methyltransferase [Streptococcus pneumoniae]